VFSTYLAGSELASLSALRRQALLLRVQQGLEVGELRILRYLWCGLQLEGLLGEVLLGENLRESLVNYRVT